MIHCCCGFLQILALNLLLDRSHQEEIIIVKRLIQGRNNVTRVQVEPISLDQGRLKNDAFTQYPFGHAGDIFLIVAFCIKYNQKIIQVMFVNFFRNA